MEQFNFIQNIRDWADQYPWLEMLSSLSIVILLAILANVFAKQIVVRGIRQLISKMPFANNQIFAEHSVIRRISNIVPAIVIMNGLPLSRIYPIRCKPLCKWVLRRLFS